MKKQPFSFQKKGRKGENTKCPARSTGFQEEGFPIKEREKTYIHPKRSKNKEKEGWKGFKR